MPTSEQTFVVSGRITLPTGAPAINAAISVFDRDLRSQKLLAETSSESRGSYTVTYTSSQFRRAEKEQADLIVRAVSADGAMRAESPIIFQAGPQETVNLQLAPVAIFVPPLSEYERLVNELTPLVEEVPFADLTDDDIDFLARKAEENRLRIRTLRRSAQFNRDHNLPTEACYGWERRGVRFNALENLLAQPMADLRRELLAAIEEQIIPDLGNRLEALFQRLDALQFETGRLVSFRFRGQLLEQGSGRPLAGYRIRAVTPEPIREQNELGQDFTDGRGLFAIPYFLIRELLDANPPPSQTIRLTITNPLGGEIEQVQVTAAPNQETPQFIEVSLPPVPDESPRIEEMALPPALVEALGARDLHTLADIRRLGRIGHLENLPLPADDPNVRRLERQANLSLLSEDMAVNNALFDAGYEDISAVAYAPRSEIVRTLTPHVGEFQAARLHVAATARMAVLNNYIVALRRDLVGPHASPLLNVDVGFGRGGFETPDADCDCQDCESAVSPGAYLADLLAYTVSYLKDDGDDIQLSWLVDHFQQPFDALVVNCEAMEQQVRQVRLCIEVLRRLYELHEDDSGGGDIIIGEAPATLFELTAGYRQEAYHSLLNQLGNSFQELQRTLSIGEEERIAGLAERLGVLPPRVSELFLDPEVTPNPLTEARLEEIFGLVDTTRDPLAEGDTPLLVAWRREYLRQKWIEADWPIDAYTDSQLPIIDPDLIGPDDFRQPTAGEPPYDLWLQRRTTLDQMRQELIESFNRSGPNSTLEQVIGSRTADLVTLQQDLVAGVEPETTQTTLAQHHLTAERLARLIEILFAFESGQVTDQEDISDFVNILVQVQKERDLFAGWRAEEATLGIILGFQTFWVSLREPAEGAWPVQFTDGIPTIDPALVDLTELPEATAGQIALGLWEDRQQQLNQIELDLQQEHLQNGFEAMLSQAIGQPTPGDRLPHDLDALQTALLSLDPDEVAGAQQSINDDLHLSLEDFQFLMELRARDASADPGLQPTAEELDQLYTILQQAHKTIHLYPLWLDEEAQPVETPPTARPLDLRSAYWRARKARLPRWQAPAEARQAWQQALISRAQPALIDPDLIFSLDYLADATSSAWDLWEARHGQLQAWEGQLAAVRDSAATPTLAFESMLTGSDTLEMPVLGVSIEDLQGLAEQSEQGESITGRLAQLSLTGQAFNYLLHVLEQVESDAVVTNSQWHDLFDILIQVAKNRLMAAWRAEEQAEGIYLGPEFFQLPPPPEGPLHPDYPWRASFQAFLNWRNRLKSRMEQVESVSLALQEAVSATEEQTLPTLRDNLLNHADFIEANGNRPKVFTDQYLIDALADGCQLTTRISQAIATIQLLLWQIRTGQRQDSQPDWVLDDDFFDERWQWIGSYQTWRAAMFVTLYPENTLDPSLRRRQTPGFRAFVDALRTNQRVTPQTGCQAALAYFAYYDDITHLVIRASCEAKAAIFVGSKCSSQAKPFKLNLFFLFGTVNNKVYWCTRNNASDSGYAQSFWQQVPILAGVHRILGAIPHAESILLFVEIHGPSGTGTIGFTRLDLNTNIENNEWSSLEEIELPDNVQASQVVVAEQFDKEPPYLFAFDPEEQDGYQRQVFIDNMASEQDNSNESAEDEWGTFPTPPDTSRILSATKFRRGFIITFDIDQHVNVIVYNKFFFSGFGSFFGYSWGSVNSWRGNMLWLDVNTDTNERTTIYSFFSPSDYVLHEIDADFDVFLVHQGNGGGNVVSNSSENQLPDPDEPRWRAYAVWSLSQNFILRLSEETVPYGDKTIPLTPKSSGPNPLVNNQSPSAFTDFARRLLLQNLFEDHQGYPASVLTYFEEAYYFVPVYVALQLQRGGHYIEALDSFRVVYNYNEAEGNRKIYYGLIQEESLDFTHERLDDWLLDPLNPHAIAATRYNTYTRFTLLAIIRCLLDYGDAEFTRDTSESVPQARELYRTALDLLDSDDLRPGPNSCEELLGELEIEVGEPYEAVLFMLLTQLNEFNRPSLLQPVILAINEVGRNENLDDRERITRIRTIIGNARATIPRSPSLAQLVVDNQERTVETQMALLRHPLVSAATNRAVRTSSQEFTRAVALQAELPVETLETEVVALPWLGLPMLASRVSDNGHSPGPSTAQPMWQPLFNVYADAETVNPPLIPPPSFEFCIPGNPLLDALRLRAENNLYKIRHCRNIAGLERQLEPYAAPTDTTSGLPMAIGGQLVLPGVSTFKPTLYRYGVLMERAKQLVQLAAQMEAAMLAALEKRDNEAYLLLKARQDVALSRAGIRLQNLRVKEAEGGVELAQLQQERAQLQVDRYQEWIDAGLNESEETMIAAYEDEAKYEKNAVWARAAHQSYGDVLAGVQAGSAIPHPAAGIVAASIIAGLQAATWLAATNTADAIDARKQAHIASINASLERNKQQWELQKAISEKDVEIGAQQIELANQRLQVVEQERVIAALQAEHAAQVVDFLSNKFTNVEMYDWMSNVLEGVYGFFLQQATAVAKLAENQLAFERQQVPPPFIQADYWDTSDGNTLANLGNGSGPDRRGLTGSARLLQDIYQLDQYAFETDEKKLHISRTISLAQSYPIEFQLFRETGVITFATPMELFDRDFPGHYLRLIKQVRTSIVALIPPTNGTKATLTNSGLSRVVIGDILFQTVNVNRGPETVALSAPFTATGALELNARPDILLPFEGLGVDTTWELRLPKAANQFDFTTIADVLFTVDYTALQDYTYQQQVLQTLDPTLSANRAFSFRNELADQFYDLHNPDQTATPMTVRFETRRQDFPPNLNDLRIEHIVLYFARAEEIKDEITVEHLHFSEANGLGTVGGSATSIDGIISTRKGNAGSWLTMIGKKPFGEWELALPDTQEVRALFQNEQIEDILFVITYGGETPAWPL